MRLLKMVVEGHTEQAFCDQVLKPYLFSRGVTVLAPVRLDGVGRSFKPLLKEIQRVLRGNRSATMRFSTMIDLYGLPHDFPGTTKANRLTDPIQRAMAFETAFAGQLNDHRMIPYFNVHEFEALLLVQPTLIPAGSNQHRRSLERLALECSRAQSPEHINDGFDTRPAARIQRCVPDFEKTVDGLIAAKAIGIEGLREKCQHFGSWLTRLEQLGQEQ